MGSYGEGEAAPGRFSEAMRLLRWVEQRSKGSRAWRSRSYRVGGLVALRASVSLDDLVPPPALIARSAADARPTLRARCRADVVRLGKFDVDDVVRFRAFYCTGGASTVLRVQGHQDARHPGIARAVEARTAVATHAPWLAPPLLEYEFDAEHGVAYLREGLLVGRSVRTGTEIQEAAERLAVLMRGLYEGVGISRARFSSLVPASLLDRWEQAVDAGFLPRELLAPVRRLVARDACVEVSLGHGDLVRSNIIRTADDVVLVDWEHARPMSIAADFSKLLPLVADPDATLQVLRGRLDGVVAASRDCYSLAEQFALAYVRTLASSAVSADRARSVGRQDAFARTQRDRIAMLGRLLATAAE